LPGVKNVGNGNGGGGCGCDCGCGGGTKDPSPASLPGATGGPSSGGGPVKVHPVYTADGTGDALDSFASLPTICCKQAPPIGVPIGKTPLAPHIRVNPATGNLVIQWAPPAAATLDAVPLSTYNSDSPSTSVYGAGYTNFYNRSATIQGTSFITVNAGDGTSYAYGPRNFTTNYLTPPPGASNTLFWDLGPIIETQPDGTQYIYGGTGNPRFLTGIKAPNGSTWTVNRDAQTNNVTNVISPAGKRVTWSYAACRSSSAAFRILPDGS
jgi:hypothetical protein